MAVKFTKPEINVREKLAELDKPSGIAGEAMLRAETVAEQQALIGVGRRNLIINGDFKVSQRGTYTSTTTLTNTATYYLDRWKFYTFTNTSGTFQHKLDQTLPDGTVTNTHLHTSTSSDMNAPLVQLVEDHKAVWGKHFTVSFWYKSNKETYYNIWNGTSQIHFLVPNSGGAWKKWEQTYKLKENGAYFRLEFYGHTVDMTSGSYLELAQVQIELGKVATPFEHRSYGEELALCERYYQRVPVYHESIIGQCWNTTSARFPVQLPVEMRSDPTITVPGPGTSGYSMKPLTASLSWPGGSGNNAVTTRSPRHFYVTCTGYSGLVAGNASTLYAGSNYIYIKCDAEL